MIWMCLKMVSSSAIVVTMTNQWMVLGVYFQASLPGMIFGFKILRGVMGISTDRLGFGEVIYMS